MTDHTDCIFCGIVRGTIPAVRVCEDERTIAFMDLYPAGPGHTLVIPKLHAANLFEIAPADLTAVALTTQRVARAVREALAPDGIRIMQTNGAAAGQTVFHYHMHILPRQTGQQGRSHGQGRADDATLEALAAQIRAAL